MGIEWGSGEDLESSVFAALAETVNRLGLTRVG
jgi:hypothetical protein